MRKKTTLFISLLLTISSLLRAQSDAVINNMVKEASEHSQLQTLGHQLFDVIGPRLIGSPQMKAANDWAVAKYKTWGIAARNEKWGEWRGWQRGISHIDLLSPRVRTLEGTQLAWSPATPPGGATAEVILLPMTADSAAFQAWLPAAKGKMIMISAPQPTGRPDTNWAQWATKASYEKMKSDRTRSLQAWRDRITKTGLSAKALARALENAGVAGIITSNWSAGFGVDKIFGANTLKAPTVDIALEDYSLLYRLVEDGSKPVVRIQAESKESGVVPTFNTIAEIKGTEKPNEYVMLSAHFDSWDGASGATDNGTGTIMMMEAMRILKMFYPHPKRTILVGHWSSEEQGLNGSRAFVEDHPEIVSNLQALFNQDNGTGRVVNLSGQGFAGAKDYLSRWLEKVPDSIKSQIKTSFPGFPSGGGSDNASFVAAGAPGFSLSSASWDYGTYTWHTNRDTYDKVVFDDVRSNVILAAILVYMASEDGQRTSTEKSALPADPRTGQPGVWPQPVKANRHGGLD